MNVRNVTLNIGSIHQPKTQQLRQLDKQIKFSSAEKCDLSNPMSSCSGGGCAGPIKYLQ
ncbi:MAG: hypothetical protein KTR14_00445 [Vampirovibrio sp.]|nr:hypothetical protein [Vampirovibrio sp.]